ncbi:MAG: signal peptidase I [Chloroflexota bacterium]
METFETEGQAHPEAPEQEKIHWGRLVLDIVETLALAALLFVGINAISARVRVDGFSMRPTLEDGEFVLVNRLAYRIGDFERGDIIVFHYPMDPNQELIKRVIGLPGDTVYVQHRNVSVNGQILVEPYIAEAPAYEGNWQVPEGFLFVLGDNRNDSSDSHSWGLLPIDNVVGKAILIYWPPPMWNVIEHTDIAAMPAR